MVLFEKSLIFCGGGQVEKIDRVLSFNSYFINVPCCFYQGSYARLTRTKLAALQNGFKKLYKRAVKALGCSSRKFWLQWKAL